MGKGKFEPGDFRLRVRRSKTGKGLFTEDEIPKGACVIEYIGREISETEAYTSRSKYLFEISKKRTIDGSPFLRLSGGKRNVAGYINHSCRPNAESETHKGRVYIMALRKIRAGEELTYDYGEEYFDEYLGKDRCRCEKCVEQRAKGR